MRMRRREIRKVQERDDVRLHCPCDSLTIRLCLIETRAEHRRQSHGVALFPGEVRQTMAILRPGSRAPRSPGLLTQPAQSVQALRVALAPEKYFRLAHR